MNKFKNYISTVHDQVYSLNEQISNQSTDLFAKERVHEAVKQDVTFLRGLKRIFLTGCGDSYTATGLVARKFNFKVGDCEIISCDPMEFTRFLVEKDLVFDNDPSKTLIVAVSASGGSPRIVEMLEKGKACNVHSILISNNPQSKGGLVADSVFHVKTPELANTPGLRSYIASLLALSSLCAEVAVSKEVITREDKEKICIEFVNYARSLNEETLDSVSQQMFGLAQEWLEVEKFEIVGDFENYYSAEFTIEKIVECLGKQSFHIDSESWKHINYFLRDEDTIGTVFITNISNPGYDNMVSAIKLANSIGRKVLVVTDELDKRDYETFTVKLPSSSLDQSIYSYFSFIAPALLTEFIALLNGVDYFGSFDTKEKLFDHSRGVFDFSSSGTSEVVVVK